MTSIALAAAFHPTRGTLFALPDAADCRSGPRSKRHVADQHHPREKSCEQRLPVVCIPVRKSLALTYLTAIRLGRKMAFCLNDAGAQRDSSRNGSLAISESLDSSGHQSIITDIATQPSSELLAALKIWRSLSARLGRATFRGLCVAASIRPGTALPVPGFFSQQWLTRPVRDRLHTDSRDSAARVPLPRLPDRRCIRD